MDWTPLRLPDGHYCYVEDTCLSAFMRRAGRLDHDRSFLKKICTHIRPGSVVIDGGAFLGDHAIAYAKTAGRVLAFEPYWPSYLGLCANVFVGRHFNVTPIYAGLSDNAEHIVFGPKPANVGAIVAKQSQSLCKEPGEVLAHPEEPVACRLDQQGVGDVGLIKLDLEGWEVRALCGARNTIERDKPILVLEVNSGALTAQGTSEQELFSLIASLGYQWQAIKGTPGGECCDILAFHPENAYP